MINIKYKKLDKSKTLAGFTVKNPLVMAPMTTFSANPDGTVSQAEIKYYKRRAKEVGLVISAASHVSESGKGFKGQFAAYSDAFIPSLKSLADAIQSENALAILQLYHGGRMALPDEVPGGDLISASAVAAERPNAVTPREMTEKEIEEIIQDFVQATKRAIQAGFDGVEIHGANTYLIQQFFSPHSNRRNDSWGGSIDKRMKFPLKLIDEIKDIVKENSKGPFIIGYRFSPEELENPGITLEDTVKLVDTLADQGLSYLHVSFNDFCQSSIRDTKTTTPIVEKIISTINHRVPFIGVGSIHLPEDAVKALEKGADFIGLGRAIVMDPEWMSKTSRGKEDEIKTSLETTGYQALEIPTPLWDGILARPGWFPMK